MDAVSWLGNSRRKREFGASQPSAAQARGNEANSVRRVKLVATSLVIVAFALYVVSRGFEQRYPSFALVAAFAEAALVGALADWFAVVALFRHPLGIPIPHTAIIPRNKNRVAEDLGRFIAQNFLGSDAILQRMSAFNPAVKLAGWLARRENAQTVGVYSAKAIAFWLDAVEDERVQRFLSETVLARLESLDFARLAGDLLEALTEGDKHQLLLDRAIRRARALLRLRSTREAVAARVAAELDAFLKTINYNNFIGRFAAKKLMGGIARFLSEIAKEENHAMRRKFNAWVGELIFKLKHDERFRVRGGQIRDEILKRPEVAAYLEAVWRDVRTWLRNDLESSDSRIRSEVSAATIAIGEKLSADQGMQSWINEKALAIAGPLVEQNRDKVGAFIADQVRDWDERHMVEQVEMNIGKDLQFIRINGTLVGGLIGLGIYGLTRFIAG